MKMAILFCLALAGCDIPNAVFSLYVLRNYGDVHGEMIEVKGHDFAVLDKPEEGRMLIARFGRGLPASRYRTVAETFLEGSGRRCAIDRVEQITDRQFELYYECD